MITVTNLTSGNSTGSSCSTAPITPTANRLILVAVHNWRSSGGPIEPTVSGDGLTFVKIAGFVLGGFTSNARITLFRAMSSSPSTGALTIDFAGQSQQWVYWSVASMANVVTTGANGANAVVQSATQDNTVSTTNHLIATLGAFSNPNNATFGWGWSRSNRLTHGANFADVDNSSSFIATEFANNNQTSVDWTLSSDSAAGIAIEIKAQPLVGGGFLNKFLN